MANVTYTKNVSDSNVKTVIQRIADHLGKDITVHSGDRNFVPSGGSQTSLHLHKRAADFHITGMSDTDGFAAIKAAFNSLFDATEAYEFIHHGQYTATGGPHLHMGRYGNGRKGYVKFKTEGLTPGSGGNYAGPGSETKNFSAAGGGRLPMSVVSGNSVGVAILSPAVGISESVGIGGRNGKRDVIIVQRLLNQARNRLIEAKIMFRQFRALTEDGISGPKTKEAITIFQGDILRFTEPDGRVDPGGKTIRSLYTAAHGSIAQLTQNLRRVAVSPVVTPPNSANWNGVLAWGAHPNVSSPFRDKTIQISNELGIKDPSWLMTVMAFETGRTFAPDKKNEAGSSGTGLIQFMKSTIDGKDGKPGLGAKLGITHSQLAGMSAVRQLDIVKAYFQQFGNKAAQAKDVDDLYFLVLLPSAFGKSDDAAMFTSGTRAYTQNRGLDKDRDGKVTVAETAQKIRSMLREGLDKYPFQVR